MIDPEDMGIPFTPEINLPINADYYQPSIFFISALTTGISTTVTTSVDHNYVIGQTIRLMIPKAYGSWQISGEQGNVTSIPSATQVVVDINSKLASAFIASPVQGPSFTQPQIAAIGDVNSGPINTGRTNQFIFISGSFINVSPI